MCRRSLAAHWADGTPLAGLAARLDALGDPEAETVAAAIGPILEDAGWLDGLIARLAVAAREDDFIDLPLTPVSSSVHAGLLLYRGPHAALYVGVGHLDALAAKRVRPRAGAIVMPGQLGMMRVLSAGDAILSLWRGGWQDGRVVESCVSVGSLRLSDGDIHELDGRDTGFVVEHMRRDLVMLQATIFAGSAPTLCAYDADTLQLSGLGAAREEASRAQMLVTLLAELGIPDADAFAAASRLPEPYARWHAMRAWTTIDADAARLRLRQMAGSDPDPELRALAAHTLALVETQCRA